MMTTLSGEISITEVLRIAEECPGLYTTHRLHRLLRHCSPTRAEREHLAALLRMHNVHVTRNGSAIYWHVAPA